jgi:predicted nucleotide-binding protein (sugar kinase/HSP70/actin superfamily)
VNETENDRLRQAVERLMSGQQEALQAIEQAFEEQESFAQETLAEVQDILSGAYGDARSILGIDEGGRGA